MARAGAISAIPSPISITKTSAPKGRHNEAPDGIIVRRLTFLKMYKVGVNILCFFPKKN